MGLNKNAEKINLPVVSFIEHIDLLYYFYKIWCIAIDLDLVVKNGVEML